VAVLRRYQEQYVGRLDQVRQNLIDLQAAEYQAAAYYLAAKQKKAAVDKRALLEATEVGSSLFHRILLDLERVCLEATAGGGGSSAESSLPATGARNAHKPAMKSGAVVDTSVQLQQLKRSSFGGGAGLGVQKQHPSQAGGTKGAAGVAAIALDDKKDNKENTVKRALPAAPTPTPLTALASSSSVPAPPALAVPTAPLIADGTDPDCSLQDELQLAAMAAQQRSLTLNATKRKLQTGASAGSGSGFGFAKGGDLKATEAARHGEKHRQQEAERVARAVAQKQEQRESYEAWRARTLTKKRKKD
jgi:hypothetical protein